ncbi:hypothetical protein BU16DRAFT_554233 [Lophium mytilinum]|uniref:BTB domain-containing protein n=1 Tax=Lophium mytilinum TaxID=390894 RepID=A0A6A6RBU4_9PEZI|nr:hypothetical protein BU16DRAFT_554233 [Lophium mytilinum]
MTSRKREGSPIEQQGSIKRRQHGIDTKMENPDLPLGKKMSVKIDELTKLLRTQHTRRQDELQAIKNSLALYYNETELSDVEIRLLDVRGDVIEGSRYRAHRLVLHQSLVFGELLFAQERHRVPTDLSREPYVESILRVPEQSLRDIEQFFQSTANDPSAQTDRTEDTIRAWLKLYADHVGVGKDGFEEVLRLLYDSIHDSKDPEISDEDGLTNEFQRSMNKAIVATKFQVHALQVACSERLKNAATKSMERANGIHQPDKMDEFHTALSTAICLYYSNAPASSPHDPIGRTISDLVTIDAKEFLKTEDFKELVAMFPDFKSHMKITGIKVGLTSEFTLVEQPPIQNMSTGEATADTKSAPGGLLGT